MVGWFSSPNRWLRIISHPSICNSCSTVSPASFSLLLIVRRLIIVVVHSLISTPTWRLIQVVTQVDIQFLPSAHIPCTLVRAIDTRNTPLEIVPTPCKRSVRVLALGEANSKRHAVYRALLGYHSIEKLDRLTGSGY